MKVSLISYTMNPLDTIYIGARTCYHPGCSDELKELAKTLPEEKKVKFVQGVIKSGHLSVTEHVNFTFAIDEISRMASEQLLRHRHTSPSVRSFRYTTIKEDKNMLRNASNEQLVEIMQKYVVGVDAKNAKHYAEELVFYLEELERGVKPEDARNLLPMGTKTSMVDTFNLRELMHICNERLCTRAQAEIREGVGQMKKEVVDVAPWVEPYLVPKCGINGICNERQSCGLYKIFQKQR